VEIKAEGQTVLTTSTGPDGTYDVHLPPGDYTVVFSAVDYLGQSFEGVNITHDQTTTLDASLQACIWVKGAGITSSPFQPQIGETVTFTATVGAGETPISYSWEFGDEQSGSGQVVTNTYGAQGSYLATLTASNACGVPAISIRLVPVEVELFYLPLISSTQN
jgi:PKD repeat protein